MRVSNLFRCCINSGNKMDNNDKNPKACLRCGNCCRGGNLSLIDMQDMEKWEKHNRQDIIDKVKELNPVWAGDHFFSAGTGKRFTVCPFLKPEGDFYFCIIYDLRPEVCIRFKPGSSMLCPEYVIPQKQKSH